MNDEILQTSYFSHLQQFLLYNLISESVHQKINELLIKKDPKILKIFETYDWSGNENAFLVQIMSLIRPEEESMPSAKKRPPSVTVPFNRELSYYSTMESQCSNKALRDLEKSCPLAKTQRSDKISLNLEKQDEFEAECIEETEDLNCSFGSMASSVEENKNSISKKMQFLKSLKLQNMNYDDETEETSEQSTQRVSSELILVNKGSITDCA